MSNTFFQGGEKISTGFRPPAPPGYGPDYNPDKDGILNEKHCSYISKYCCFMTIFVNFKPNVLLVDCAL